MKNSMQVIAMAAFLGCFAIMAVAAGGEKVHPAEGCGDELHEKQEVKSGPVEERAGEPGEKEVAVHWKDHSDELIFPAQFFHRVI